MARRKKNKRVNLDNLAPGIAEGLAQGQEEIEAADATYTPAPSGAELVRHMHHSENVEGTRVPLPRSVIEPNAALITDETGRTMQDVNITFRPETLSALRAGNICLRCHEPQPSAFPETCDLCGYAMKERQIIDLAMEFEGEKHIGPSKPISEYLQEQDLRMEKRRFDQKLQEHGHVRGVVLS